MELLIVIVVIGILAAITIVAFNGVQNRAYDTTVQSDLTSMYKKIALFETENGKMPKNSTDFNSMGLKLSKSSYSRGMNNGTSWYNVLFCWPNATNPYKFAVVAQSKSGNVFQAVNGGTTQAPYALEGSYSTCASVGVPMDTGSERTWFYDSDTWQSYIGG